MNLLLEVFTCKTWDNSRGKSRGRSQRDLQRNCWVYYRVDTDNIEVVCSTAHWNTTGPSLDASLVFFPLTRNTSLSLLWFFITHYKHYQVQGVTTQHTTLLDWSGTSEGAVYCVSDKSYTTLRNSVYSLHATYLHAHLFLGLLLNGWSLPKSGCCWIVWWDIQLPLINVYLCNANFPLLILNFQIM